MECYRQLVSPVTSCTLESTRDLRAAPPLKRLTLAPSCRLSPRSPGPGSESEPRASNARPVSAVQCHSLALPSCASEPE
eukprot:767188-Hanusia_phi.AAC.11